MYNTNLLIIGAGEHGKVVKETALLTDLFHKIEFLDDRSEEAIGKFSDYLNFTEKYRYAFVALGNTTMRSEWIDELAQAGYEIPVIIHPYSYVSKSAVLAPGVIVEAGAVINTNVKIGKGSIVGINVSIDHDAVIGECCTIYCGSSISPKTVIADNTRIETGTVVK